ncbi:amidohydrolase family protein [Sphingosinicella soli]|uniref:Putative TIM-barrel fold metal-dependent hydrolase n=1 Tax=Sphingosinicella soli TaxID=333708 RepID=A0A7W7F5U4_9SPHN|nr:amidohydrolase family protein [Sphingosinicella soli]MBB4631671.1 putative TIM-barrel fold metal-dependent hydrolase [Sphingosinicella soli]
MSVPAATLTYSAYREDWLALHDEPVIDPDLPIIDAHHHVWDTPRPRYMPEQLIADVGSGHRIVATVYVDCRSMYRDTGAGHLKAVGEVEFANGIAAMGRSGAYGSTRLCAAIVSHVDLRHPDAEEALVAMIAAGGGRFRGIRQVSAWDSDPDIIAPSAAKPRDLLRQPDFRRGFGLLSKLGLSFDAFLYHHQLDDLVELAEAFPDTPIILDHIGAPIGIGRFSGKRDAVFRDWRDALDRLRHCPNVQVKIGGMGMRLMGFGFEHAERPPDSAMLAAAWRPYVETCIALFGPSRAMFESNFPPDKGSCSYKVLWNAFKIICAGASQDERSALFAGTAAQTYGIDIDSV